MTADASMTTTRGDVRVTTLDNGLTVLLREVHTAPLVSVWCWYRVGSKDEGPGLTGVSHWVERMNFKGTTHIGFCSFESDRLPGPLVVHAGVNAANVDRALESIDDEIARMSAEGVTDTELDNSKRYLIGSLPRTLETNAGIAGFLQSVQRFDLGLDYDQRLPGLLEAVTRDQVNAAAARTLSPERATVAIAGPYEDRGS